MDQDKNHRILDDSLPTSKADKNFGRCIGSDFETSIFDSHIRLVVRWIPQLLSREALESIDEEQLSNDIVEELIRQLANQALESKMPCEKTMRFCRQITKSHCINAIRHIRCQKRARHRENIDLESIVNPGNRKDVSESESVVDYKDFVHAILSYLPLEYQRVVELAILDFTRTEIADEVCVSRKVLQRMFSEIGVVVNQIIKNTSGHPLPITHCPSPITHHPSPITHHPSPMKNPPNDGQGIRATNSSDGILKKCQFFWSRRFKFLALVL